MKFILGTKIGMTQIHREDGSVLPVTVIAAGPVMVTQLRTLDRDGYLALQVGFSEKKRVAKPQRGHLKDLPTFRWLREFRIAENGGVGRGTTIDVSAFQAGDRVAVSGVSKGKGFAGGVKRHHFRGGWASHGAKHSLRQPGSIGSSWPERVRKGKRMAGRMGHERVTVKNLEVVHVDRERNLLALRGAVPGARGTLLEIRGVV
ncbi:MAG: 50S ribosomal protein L3 [Candidatus Terrybacteria bacterium RIFCSPLOWO2_01_FULL_58_14]|uniref:Large ribosomal subunit protein uL3 n=2 Tax=Candidatus Terryibacteriota TaxID=1817920 RepID=A0A1G2PYV6_9BACT|nr:MAG: 50S ribosomal protein L3 [Candidatus Terrybacteria bacterium RIFCSPHIGHO2_01_FULL_58_15]OHA52772.1 MAG: 50S ribosomal protein L3 [Candidatus Terrybacteria bacterium RIFCSPLOWO2_01_FULL_58_14]